MRLDDAVVRGTAVLGAVALVGASGCAHDRILDVPPSFTDGGAVADPCGNLTKEGDEECDVASPGCAACVVAPGWACTDADCAPVCGDGTVLGDEECDPPDGVTCDSSCRAGAKAEACDMTGLWILRQTDFSLDDVVQQVQTSTNWYVFQVSQTGDTFQVEKAINCGIRVTGSATVDLTDEGVRGLIHLNPQDVDSPRGPRQGTFAGDSGGCTFAMDRNYMVRGGEARFLPADFLAKPELSTLSPLPYEDTPENPGGANSAGQMDVDGDGHPGVGFHISGNASGVRNVIQRDWNDYFVPTGSTIPANSIEFTATATFDNQENILHVSHCPLVGCGILLAGSAPAKNLPGRVTFRYLGKALADAGVARILVGELKQSVDGDMQSCANVRLALPHDPSKK